MENEVTTRTFFDFRPQRGLMQSIEAWIEETLGYRVTHKRMKFIGLDAFWVSRSYCCFDLRNADDAVLLRLKFSDYVCDASDVDFLTVIERLDPIPAV